MPPGYYRCPENSACLFSERDGKGEMCDWTEASTDWGRECPWAGNKAVKSVFNNANELDPDHALVYLVERDHQHRKGCTSVHTQGNLAGHLHGAVAQMDRKMLTGIRCHALSQVGEGSRLPQARAEIAAGNGA